MTIRKSWLSVGFMLLCLGGYQPTYGENGKSRPVSRKELVAVARQLETKSVKLLHRLIPSSVPLATDLNSDGRLDFIAQTYAPQGANPADTGLMLVLGTPSGDLKTVEVSSVNDEVCYSDLKVIASRSGEIQAIQTDKCKCETGSCEIVLIKAVGSSFTEER